MGHEAEHAVTMEGLDERLHLRCVRGREALGQLFEYELELLCPAEAVNPRALLGCSVTIGLCRANEGERHFNGIVSKVSSSGTFLSHDVLRATVSPRLWLAQQGRNCRVFQDMTIPDVVKAVLDPLYLSVSTDRLFLSDYRKWDYLVQYRESDFAFVSRLLEQEGVYYYFEHARKEHRMVLADSLASHNPIQGYERLPVVPAGVKTHLRDYVTDWREIHQTRSGFASVCTHEFRFNRGANLRGEGRAEPGRLLEGEAEREIYEPLEHYVIVENAVDSGGSDRLSFSGFRAEAERYAKNLVQEQGVEREQFEGEGVLRSLSVGSLFGVDRHGRSGAQMLTLSTEWTLRNPDPRSLST